MSNDINIINKAGNDLNVTVNNIGGNIQIIISKKINIDLLTINAGDTFDVNNIKYIVLEKFPNNQTAVIRKELLEDDIKFNFDNNNWKTSNIQKFLNGEYLGEIEKAFGKDRIVEHTVNLLSMDGLDDYGTSNDKVSLLTIGQYRRYRKLLGDNLDRGWWLVTPDSTHTGNNTCCVLFVTSGGNVCDSGCSYYRGVRPFFILQS